MNILVKGNIYTTENNIRFLLGLNKATSAANVPANATKQSVF